MTPSRPLGDEGTCAVRHNSNHEPLPFWPRKHKRTDLSLQSSRRHTTPRWLGSCTSTLNCCQHSSRILASSADSGGAVRSFFRPLPSLLLVYSRLLRTRRSSNAVVCLVSRDDVFSPQYSRHTQRHPTGNRKHCGCIRFSSSASIRSSLLEPCQDTRYF